MKLELAWKGDLLFEASAPSGAKYLMESSGDGGPTPIEAFVSSLAACSAMDVVSILKKSRQPLEAYRVEVEWERGPKDVYPRPVTKIVVRHVVKGKVDPKALEKAVRLSDQKYCGVTATLRSGPELVTESAVED